MLLQAAVDLRVDPVTGKSWHKMVATRQQSEDEAQGAGPQPDASEE